MAQKIYFGSQTKKALKNFPFSFRRTPKEFIMALVETKKAAGLAHFKAGELDRARQAAICKACDEILAGQLDDQFVLPAFQGGAGTSNHMNVNEVIANRATEILNKAGKNISVHANDHVNLSQSTNDCMPSALKIAAFRLTCKLLQSLDVFIDILQKKAAQFANLPKLGRTHMQDAVPITLGSEFLAFREYMLRGRQRIKLALANLLELNLGGSAVGNSINASKRYIREVYKALRKITKIDFRPANNLMSQASSNTDVLNLSQSLTSLCLDLSKIANDLKLLSSGPMGGLREISLPQLQPGSSIMPGKINPILPEAVNQLYFLVSGNNLTIEHAAHGAQLEMGVMLPVVTDRLLESLKLTDEIVRQFGKKCLLGIRANKKRLREVLENSTAYAACLTPHLGYDAVAEAVKKSLASTKPLRKIIIEEKLLTGKEFDRLTS